MKNKNISAKPSYELSYNLDRDIWNWFYGANYSNNGDRHFTKKKDLDMVKRLRKIKSLKAATPILKPFLKEKSADPNGDLMEFLDFAKVEFKEKFNSACQVMEKITNRPLSNSHFTLFVTTFPRMIVFYDDGIIFMYAKIDRELWGNPIDGFLHELLHFQTDKYWRQNPGSPVSKLSEKEYFKLKESLTVILDEELKPIIELPDCSYPEFGKLRNLLHEHWKKNHNFDKLVNYGCELITNGI